MLILEKWVESKQKNKRIGLSKSLLFLCSVFYRSLVASRHFLYDFGVLRSVKAPLPVVSVGNIVCGGTGKSEFVAKLVADIKEKNVALLSRGYRSKRKGGSRVLKDIDDGDEPFMLSQKCPLSTVIVGEKRERSAELAKNLGCKVVILDDGMQYLRLKKDIEIVLLRADDPFGKGFVPFGMRRELIKKLSKANFIVIHGDITPKNYELVKSELLCYSTSKCFGTRYHIKSDKNSFSKKVGVFCGIGNPQAFIKGVNAKGLTVVKKRFLADHEKMPGLEKFLRECKKAGAEDVVCTTKDYVKLNAEEKKLVSAIEISMEISYDADVYHTLIEQINNNIEI